MRSLWAKKSLQAFAAEATDETSEFALRRSLGPTGITFLGVGAIIGTGIFILTGTVAAHLSGPAVVLSYVIAGIVCTFTALCYAEFAAMIPVSGSAYSYAYATLGEFVAWIIAWNLILEYLIAASIVAVGWSGYVNAFLGDFGIVLPAAIASAPLAVRNHAWVWTGAVINLPAIALIAALTLILARGVKKSAGWNTGMVLIKLAAVLLVIAFGVKYVAPRNWHPFIPPNTGTFGEFGWSGVLRGAAVVFFAYTGFDMVASAAQEAKRPERDMPIGILASLGICTVLYVCMALVMTGMVPYSALGVSDPAYVALDAAGPALNWVRWVVTIGILVGLPSAVLICLYGQSRIFYVMARDGLLPPLFAKVESRSRTPVAGTLIVGMTAAAVAAVFPLDLLGELSSIGTLLAFAIVCAGVWVLRRTAPDLPRPFRVPYATPVCIAGIVGSIWLMLSLPVDTWIRLVVWLAIGVAVYAFYSASRSKVGRTLRAADPQ